jgi:cytochrome c551/c552
VRWGFAVIEALVWVLAAAAQTPEAIVERRCLPCHNDRLDNAGLSFEKRDSVTARSAKIVAAMTHQGELKMPPGPKLPASEIAAITAWIQKGAGNMQQTPAPQQLPFELWTFDRLENIAGYATKVEGHPRVIETPVGKAVEFNGVDDALFIDAQPLAGAAIFTWEVIFRPDPGGHIEQRFFHLQEKETQNRFLFELRVHDENWFLDSFVNWSTGSKALLNKEHEHPLGKWYHIAQVFDGQTYRNYIDGQLENEAPIAFTAIGAGETSVGVRINRRDYFKGAIAKARFTRGALKPMEFLSAPGK